MRCVHGNGKTILTIAWRNHVCVCVFQTSPMFSCESDEECQEEIGSNLANGEHELRFKPF